MCRWFTPMQSMAKFNGYLFNESGHWIVSAVFPTQAKQRLRRWHCLVAEPAMCGGPVGLPRLLVFSWSVRGLVRETYSPFGLELIQWFAPVGGATVVANQAQAWFRQWGMDLKAFPDDRNARNASSYQPDGLPSAWHISAPDVLNFVSELWHSLEPSANSRFDNVDRHILRASVEAHFKAIFGKSAPQAPKDFDRFVKSIVSPQSFSSVLENEIVRFLKREIVQSDSMILIRSREPNTTSGSGAETIASRAALLLRTASGAAADLLRAVGILA